MRSFFKRPSWATKGDEDLESNDFYRRAGQTYADIIAASKEARDSPLNRSANTSTEDGRPCKRRHILPEPVPRSTASPVLPDDGKEKNDIQVRSSSRLGSYNASPEYSGRNDYQTPVQPAAGKIGAAGLSNVKSSITGASQPVHYEVYPNTITDIGEPQTVNISISRDAQKNQLKAARTDQKPDSMEDDAVVQILITSKLENTKSLIVHRKISQSLRDVRLAWCNRQSIPKDMQSSIFLTWKGKRLFDVTTCRSLGIDMTRGIADNLIYGDYLQHGSKEVIRIHMEAATEDNVMPTNDRQASPISCSRSAQEFTTIGESSKRLAIEIVLKCPGLDDFSLSIIPSMQISQLVDVFRDAKGIPAGQEVYLVFDGDRLNPSRCLTDYDMAHGDLVEVMIK
ncbi:hypothetical protein ETB97_003083 [Aspergillus alliaceus]|uniref:Ubiquitin-like domain-containing protein n=1 Tax=Petromyces alliaceus TaxID=209559 RepID=A0A8H6ECC8_PETAA|nr:hypothetical protein ETB97_003083 [Aspergillus burnettii]